MKKNEEKKEVPTMAVFQSGETEFTCCIFLSDKIKDKYESSPSITENWNLAGK